MTVERNNRRTRIGVVVSEKMDKTITVDVEIDKRDELNGKDYKTNKKFKAHDENNEAKIGDTVEIMETRPLSKDKYFRLVRIVERAK